MLHASDALFELVYSGENAFHITVNHFYIIDFTNAAEIQSILGFESDTLVKGVDNPRRYYLSSSCNQVAATDSRDSHVLTMPTEYYTFFEFIEAVGVAMVKVLPLISMTIEDDYVRFNDESNSWYFDRTSVDTRSMVLVGLHSSNCHHRLTICALSFLLILCLIPVDHLYPIRRMIKVLEVMHT